MNWARGYFAQAYRVELAREVVETSIPAYTFSQFLAHQLRWARGVRDARPLGYFGLLVTFGLPWAIANVIASAASLDSIALLSVMLCVRFAMALSIGVGVLGDRATSAICGCCHCAMWWPLLSGSGVLPTMLSFGAASAFMCAEEN